MRKDEQVFTNIKPQEPPAGLFDRIILAIKREESLQQKRKILFSFILLLIISIIATPLSWIVLENQIKSSGIYYFVSAAITDFGTFLTMWREFSLAILESIPFMAIIAFGISLGIAIFTLRLFLYKKRLLIHYLTQTFSQ